MKLQNSFLLVIFSLFFFSCAAKTVSVVYEAKDATLLKADFFLPKEKSEKPFPLVVVIHGGGWKSRTGDMESICQRLTQEGFAALNITYRLVPEYRYPVQLNDVKAFVPWILRHAKDYNLNEKEISVWGYSAGAQLAFLLANQTDLRIKFKAIIVGGIPAYFPSFPNSSMITSYIGKAYTDDPQAWLAASPLTFVTEKTPATFVYHGTEDTLVEIEQAELLIAKLAQNKVNHKFYRLENRGHIGAYFFSKEAEDQAIDFLKSISP